MRFTDSNGKVWDSEDIEGAIVRPIDTMGALIDEMERYAGAGRAASIQPYTFQRWADALRRARTERP